MGQKQDPGGLHWKHDLVDDNDGFDAAEQKVTMSSNGRRFFWTKWTKEKGQGKINMCWWICVRVEEATLFNKELKCLDFQCREY